MNRDKEGKPIGNAGAGKPFKVDIKVQKKKKKKKNVTQKYCFFFLTGTRRKERPQPDQRQQGQHCHIFVLVVLFCLFGLALLCWLLFWFFLPILLFEYCFVRWLLLWVCNFLVICLLILLLQQDGTYRVDYTAPDHGNHVIAVTLNEHHVDKANNNNNNKY
jgi:hypothetical protein